MFLRKNFVKSILLFIADSFVVFIELIENLTHKLHDFAIRVIITFSQPNEDNVHNLFLQYILN